MIAVASILSGDFSRAISIVSSLFTIKDFQHNAKDDYVQFLIAESEVRNKFPALLSQLDNIGMVATVAKRQYIRWLMPSLKSARLSISGGTVLTVHRLPVQKQRKNLLLRYLPLMLFVVTVSVVFIDGYLRYDPVFERIGIFDPSLLAVVYTMSLMGILGIHELGHMIAAKHYGIKISWPYFIPMVPLLFSPTLGAMIRMRSNMPNRNAMFDVGISGPLAGLIVAIIVSVYGSSISVLIPADQATDILGEGPRLNLHPSLIMMATMQLTGNLPSDGMVLVMSPVMFAAWLGFLLTFLNLVPASQLDGGHIARATLGAKYHRIITFASIGVLGVLYPVMAVLVLIITLRAPENPPLDDVTPLSKKRKMLFAVALILTVLCGSLPPYLF
jgi:membrane-associated protease RseP (regulator of RpoE activity)